MAGSTLIEVFSPIVFSFTRGVTDNCNPEEPEFTAEFFGYNPLESTGREWYYHPVDEFIYQEYSDREAVSLDYLASSSLHIRVINACSPVENREALEDKPGEDNVMAWKRHRPSAVRTLCKSMYTGALISIVTAILVGFLYMLVSYLSYKTVHNCQFQPVNTTSEQTQWIRTMSGVATCALLYIWFFALLFFLFRPFQLKGVKAKLILVCSIFYTLDSLYRVALQALGISHSHISYLQKIPLNALFLANQCLQVYLITNHLCTRSKQKLTLFFQMIVPGCFCLFTFFIVASLIYPAYNKQENKDGKLLIALFAPLIGVALKVISRICVQRLWNITHPGYSYVLLSPLYCGSAVVFRVLQADLESLKSIAVLGILHGTAEVLERSTMVVIDHICYMLWKRKSAPWGSFRTPRRERLMADIVIMSMLFESTAIVAVNGYLYLYQFVYLENNSLLVLLQSFSIHVSVQLGIEWFFISISLAIVTRYQNMAVMAVWRRQWKRHILVAIVNAIPMAFWTSTNVLAVVYGRFSEASNKPCKMPLT